METSSHFSMKTAPWDDESAWRDLFNATSEAIFVHDAATGCVLDVNDRMLEMFGVSREEALQMSAASGSLNEPPFSEKAAHAWIRKAVESGPQLFDWCAKRKNGELFWCEVSLRKARIGGRELVLAVVRDITKHRQLEEQLRHLQKMELVGQLAAGVSHDFNNILTVINAGSSILMELLSDRPECAAWVTQILAAGERAANLTRQLLLFSRKQQMQPQAVKLNQLTNDLSKMLGRVLGEHIALDLSYEDDLPVVQGDPGMLEQVVINLAVNARDAMPQGGLLRIATGTVSFASAPPAPDPEIQPGTFVRISISDTGSGIPPEIRERIFEPFFTTKEVGKGTGLGLATVFGIVTQHRGWIDVDSTVGQGATFHIYLPACPSSAPEISGVRDLPLESGLGKTILVVEDEASVRDLIVRSLTRQGYKVLSANSGAEAQRLSREQLEQVDLLLSDLVMPGGISGRELAESLRRTCPRLRVLYCSGYSPEIMGGRLVLERGVSFMPKPFTNQGLLNAIAECLDRK